MKDGLWNNVNGTEIDSGEEADGTSSYADETMC